MDNGNLGSPGPKRKGHPSVVSLRSRGIPVWNFNRLFDWRHQARSARQHVLDVWLGLIVFAQMQSWLTLFAIVVTFATCMFFGFYREGELASDASWGGVLLCLVAIVPVFVIVVQAIQRRNEALRKLAEVKACCLSIYLAHRDWPAKSGEDHLDQVRSDMKALWECLHCYLQHTWFTTHHYSTDMPSAHNLPNFLVVLSQEMSTHVRKVYSTLKQISADSKRLAEFGVSEERMAQLYNAHHKLECAVAQLSHLKEYRTPQGLRSIMRFNIVVFVPFFSAPLWAKMKDDVGFVFACMLAIMLQVTLVGMLNLSISMEDPFDDQCLDGVSTYEASDQVLWAIQEHGTGDSPSLSLKNVQLESPSTNNAPKTQPMQQINGGGHEVKPSPTPDTPQGNETSSQSV